MKVCLTRALRFWKLQREAFSMDRMSWWETSSGWRGTPWPVPTCRTWCCSMKSYPNTGPKATCYQATQKERRKTWSRIVIPVTSCDLQRLSIRRGGNVRDGSWSEIRFCFFTLVCKFQMWTQSKRNKKLKNDQTPSWWATPTWHNFPKKQEQQQ